MLKFTQSLLKWAIQALIDSFLVVRREAKIQTPGQTSKIK